MNNHEHMRSELGDHCNLCGNYMPPESPTMNQIPNIEEIKKVLPCIDPQCDNQGTTITVNSDGEPEQMQCEYCYRERFPILDWHHQELQKAREEERERIEQAHMAGYYSCCNRDASYSEARNYFDALDHSELDQDKV